MENFRFCFLKIFIFLVVKFSVYLNRHVFVMFAISQSITRYDVTSRLIKQVSVLLPCGGHKTSPRTSPSAVYVFWTFLINKTQSWSLALVMLNKLRCHAHFQFSASLITWSEFSIEIHIFNDKQCRFRSEANWSGSTLFAKKAHVVFSKRKVKNNMLLIMPNWPKLASLTWKADTSAYFRFFFFFFFFYVSFRSQGSFLSESIYCIYILKYSK